jgi:hypothetical protein
MLAIMVVLVLILVTELKDHLCIPVAVFVLAGLLPLAWNLGKEPDR